MNGKKGHSLLELVLVLGAIAIITGGIFSYYKKQRQEAQIRETSQQINTIFEAADNYLLTAKPDGTTQAANPISMQILKDTRALPPNLGQ